MRGDGTTLSILNSSNTTLGNTFTLNQGAQLDNYGTLASSSLNDSTISSQTGVSNYSQVVTGSTDFRGTLRKTGTRTWRVDNDEIIASAVQVEQGKLIVASRLGGATVRVDSGAVLEIEDTAELDGDAEISVAGTLQGHGTMAGTTTVTGVLSPTGSASARLTFANSVTLTGDATTVFVISPAISENTAISAASLIHGGTLG